MEVMEAFAEVMEAFMEVTSTEVFMEDMDDMKASTEVTSTEALMRASVSFRGSFHGRYGRYESFRGSKFRVSFNKSFHGSNGSFRGSNGSFHGSTKSNRILLPWKPRVRVRVRFKFRLLP